VRIHLHKRLLEEVDGHYDEQEAPPEENHGRKLSIVVFAAYIPAIVEHPVATLSLFIG